MILPLGPIWYVKMSLAHRNWGVIRPYRDGRRVKVAKPVRFAVRRAPRTKVAGALASILIVVVGLGAIVTGGFIRPAPTGLVTGASAQVYGHNLIRDGNFTAPGRSNKEDRGVIQQRGGIAGDWYDESANSAGLPVYHQQGGTETLTYAANPGNVRTHFTRKVKIFQPVVPARAGQVYRFQITIQRCRVGNTFVRKNPNYPAPAYPVVGIEWFSGVRLVRDRYLGEQDVYPPISSRSETWR